MQDIEINGGCECGECSCENDRATAPEAEAPKSKADSLPKEEKRLSEELEKSHKKLDEANDKYMRLYAEYDNYRKRTAKEKEAIYSEASADVLLNILPVLDNMERAEAYADSEKVSEGVRLILSQFRDTLKKMGVEEIAGVDAKFDPNFHNAVMHVEDEAYPENTVIEVFQKGYIKGDKVIRPAVVKVAN